MSLSCRKNNSKEVSPKGGQPSLSSFAHESFCGINRLPFYCLYLIFHRIPLQNLLSLRLVSPTWNCTVIYICARMERLTLGPYSPPEPLSKSGEFDLYWIDDLSRYLVDGGSSESAYERVHFPINLLSKQGTICLVRLFPGLTELRIHYNSRQLVQSYLAKIETLFRYFSLSSSSNLRILSFTLSSNEPNFYSKKSYVHDTLCKIASHITTSRFPRLKQLDFRIAGEYFSYLSLYSTLDFQAKAKYDDMLAQLERFSLGYNSPRWDTKNTLAKLGPGLVSLSLNLTDRDYPHEPLIPMFDGVKFQSNLTHLRLSLLQGALNYHFIQAICDRFKALKFVQLQIVAAPPGYLLNCGINMQNDFANGKLTEQLSRLEHLSELRLHDFDAFLTGNSSFPRVKKLTLAKRDLISPQLFSANAFCVTLAAQFVNLEELVLVCRPFCEDINENTRAQQVEQQIGKNLNHFAHLRTTVFDFTAPEWR